MAGLLDRAKIVAEILKIGSEIYGLIIDKSRLTADHERRIKELEAELATLKARL